jgi:hypothetical protein
MKTRAGSGISLGRAGSVQATESNASAGTPHDATVRVPSGMPFDSAALLFNKMPDARGADESPNLVAQSSSLWSGATGM